MASEDATQQMRRVEERLRESEERFRALAGATFEGVVISEGGVILEANDCFAAMFGYEPSEVPGKSAQEFVVPGSREQVLGKMSEGSSEPYEVVGLRKDGTALHLEVRGRRSTYRGREVRVTAIRDATRRKDAEAELRQLNETLERRVAERTAELEGALARLKDREERLRITFEEAAVGMAHVGPDGRWLDVNPKLCQIVGYPREELLGMTFADITHPDDLEVDLGYVNRLLKGEIKTYSIEKRYIRKDRSRVWIRLTVSLVRGHSRTEPGEPSYFISVVEDVTAQKLSELVPEPLTAREIRVLSLVTLGKTNREIANDLSYSVGTVKLMVQQILAKLDVPDRASAADKAIEIGLLPPPRQR